VRVTVDVDVWVAVEVGVAEGTGDGEGEGVGVFVLVAIIVAVDDGVGELNKLILPLQLTVKKSNGNNSQFKDIFLKCGLVCIKYLVRILKVPLRTAPQTVWHAFSPLPLWAIS
jgi:hypothetical protein